MIDITIATIKDIDESKYSLYLSMLSSDMKKEVLKYRLKDDRKRTLLGKIILLNYLNRYTNFNLLNIERTSYNRPYIKNSSIDFNISHSKDYVICAFTQNNSIGVDIEALNLEIDIDEFRAVFSSNEFDFIKNANNKIETFYRLWTIKEALLKADGRGFIAEPKDIIIDMKKNRAIFEKRAYNLLSFNIDGYIYSLAFKKQAKINIKTQL